MYASQLSLAICHARQQLAKHMDPIPAEVAEVSDTSVLKPLYEGTLQPILQRKLATVGEARSSTGRGSCSCWMFVMMCINTLVRKQWTDRERLTFPIVQLPLAMTEPKTSLWRNKLFWMGFGIAFGIDVINGLSVYYPAIPQIPVGDHQS